MTTQTVKENLLTQLNDKSVHFIGQVSPQFLDLTKLFWASNAVLSISTKEEDTSKIPPRLAIFNYKSSTAAESIVQKLNSHFTTLKKPLSLVFVNNENTEGIVERLSIAKNLLHNNPEVLLINMVAIEDSKFQDPDYFSYKVGGMETAIDSVGFGDGKVKTIYYSTKANVYSKPLYKLIEHTYSTNEELAGYCLMEGLAFEAFSDGLGAKIELTIKPSSRESW